MLDFTTQKKLIEPILKRADNQRCADCDAIAPTWASLDFGVFLCSNCSGAHRGLGPTITRVRSANLDKWQQEWLENMRCGNTTINGYWESDARSAQRKPKSGASLQEIARYVFEKYIKKKWVESRDHPDPLTRYKKGELDISKPKAKQEPQPQEVPSKPFQKTVQPVARPQQPKPVKKAEVSLLDFDVEPVPVQPNNGFLELDLNQHVQTASTMEEEEEFSQFTQAASSVPQIKAKDDNLISFDVLMNQQKAPQVNPPQVPQQNPSNFPVYQNMQYQHPYHPHIAQQNVGYQGQYHQPQHIQMGQARPFSMPSGFQGQQQMGYQSQGQVQVMQPGQFW